MKRIAVLIFFALCSAAYGGAAYVGAQSGGQVCLRSYADRNANGIRDAGEPFLTRGVSANLLDAGGVIIASALLDDSPTAAQGVICFQFLPDGQYTLLVTSADYNATTPTSFTAQVSSGALPVVVEFGGAPVGLPTAPAAAPAAGFTPAQQRALLERVIVSALAALGVMAFTVMVGVFVYLFGLRPRLRRLAYTTTGSTARVPTGVYPPAPGDDLLSSYGVPDEGDPRRQ